MKLKKIMATLMTLTLLAMAPVLSLAEETTGSAAVTAGTTYTLEQMLTYAIQDEYAAQAEYEKILAAYGEDNAFGNIVGAEGTHIALLQTLFTTYGFALPMNNAANTVTLPESLDTAYVTGIAAENANIAMYNAFLAQNDLPADVRAAFTALQSASQSHLSAFTQNAENAGLGLQDGQGMQYGQTDENGNGNGNGLQDGSGTQNGDTGATQNKNQRDDGMGQGKNSRYNENNNNCVSGDCDGSGECDGDCDGTCVVDGTENQNGGQNRRNNTTGA